MRETAIFPASGLKSDVIIVFLDTNILCDPKILTIRLQIKAILHIFHCACLKWPISTSGLKSDVTIMFLGPDCL